MDYGNILQRAFVITLRHAALWVFGALAALFQSFGYVPNIVQYTIGFQDLTRPDPATLRLLEWLSQPSIILLLIAAFGVLVIVGVFIQLLTRAALIGQVGDIEKIGSTSIGAGFRHGFSRLLTLLGIYLTIWIPFLLFALVSMAIALSPLLLLAARESGTRAAGVALAVALTIIAVVALVVVAIVLSLAQEFVDRYCVLSGRGVFDSIGDGFGLVRRNLGKAALTWLLMIGVSILIGAVSFALFVFLVLVVGGAVWLASSYSSSAAIATAFALGVPAFVLLVFYSGLAGVYTSSYWTLAYLRIRELDIMM